MQQTAVEHLGAAALPLGGPSCASCPGCPGPSAKCLLANGELRLPLFHGVVPGASDAKNSKTSTDPDPGDSEAEADALLRVVEVLAVFGCVGPRNIAGVFTWRVRTRSIAEERPTPSLQGRRSSVVATLEVRLNLHCKSQVISSRFMILIQVPSSNDSWYPLLPVRPWRLPPPRLRAGPASWEAHNRSPAWPLLPSTELRV